jgi:preprotein translocase subunit YajC
MFGVMALLSSTAAFAAEESGGAPPSAMDSITSMAFPIVLFILIFYFLMYRPQKKKQQQHDKMISSISRGDTVITAGGFYAKVYEVLDDSYIIELAEGVRARILKGSVSSKRESGEEKPRPRKLKKKKRDRTDEKDKETSAESGALPKSQEEGVTMEENAVLLESPETIPDEAEEASSDPKN